MSQTTGAVTLDFFDGIYVGDFASTDVEQRDSPGPTILSPHHTFTKLLWQSGEDPSGTVK